MSIDNISIISSYFGNIEYLFDVPTLEDSDGEISYILTVSKKGVTIKKLEDYNDFFDKIKNYNTKEIKPNSKEYKLFLRSLSIYIKEAKYAEYIEDKDKTDTLISDNDLLTIKNHYQEEILKNTLKQKK